MMGVTWYEVLILIGTPSIIFCIFQLVLENFKAKKEKKRNDLTLFAKGLQMLLRMSLRTNGERYVKQGWVDSAKKQDYDECYNIYHALGKNGVMDGLYSEVMALPETPPEEPVMVKSARSKKK